MDDLGVAVRFHRKKAGLSRLELARLSGIGKTAIFDIERGKPTVRLATLLAVMRVLNMRLDWTSPLKEVYEASAHSHS